MAQVNKSKLLLIEKVLVLKSLSIFSETPETVLAEIAYLIKEVAFSEGQIIFHEGEIGNCMYIIFHGQVKIHKGEQLLATLSEKDFFGELSLLDTESRSASATPISECLLFRIDQEPFYELMESRTEVVRGVIGILCKRLREANHRLMEMTKAISHL